MAALENSLWIYVFIFVGKMVEVSMTTVRAVLIHRGERKKGTILSFFEILLWLTVTSTALSGLREDIWRGVVFALAFALGNYFGSWIEDKLAFGLCSVQVIIPESEKAQALVCTLRENKFAVTILQGSGKDGHRELLILHIKRKRIPQAVKIIKGNMEDAVVVVSDAKVIHGGFISK